MNLERDCVNALYDIFIEIDMDHDGEIEMLDFLMYFDCLVYSVAVEVMTNGTSPASAVNCTLRCHDSFACSP